MTNGSLVQQVGKALARQRKLAKLTQAQVAEKLEIEKESVSRMETGHISPTLARLEQLASLYGCPVQAFFWHEAGEAAGQAATLEDMIRSLPPEKRELIVKLVSEIVHVLR